MAKRDTNDEEDEVARLAAEVGRLNRKIARLQSGLEESESIAEHRTRELFSANSVLTRFLPPQVCRLVDHDGEEKLTARRSYLTVVFGDLAGFTDVAEVVEAEQMTAMINDYFDMVLSMVDKHGGLLDKFIGDGFMAFWGAPETDGRQEDAKKCARFALDLGEAFSELSGSWRQQGLDHTVSLRQGINSGYCSVGNFGSKNRLQYTAMGNPVNLAARLEGAAPEGGILTSHITSSMISAWIPVRECGQIKVKGIKHPVTTYTLEPERPRTAAEPLGADQITSFLGRLEETQQLDSKTMELLRQLAPQQAMPGSRPDQPT